MHCVFCERYRWIVVGRNLICVLLPSGWGGGRVLPQMTIRGCDAGQGMGFDLSVLNRVYTEFRLSLS